MCKNSIQIIAFYIVLLVTIKAQSSEEDLHTTLPSHDDIIDTTTIPKIGDDHVDTFKDTYNEFNDSRINGGEEVKQIIPFQISMQAYRRNRWRHFCGGSIISPHHVLTAAHCVENMKPEDIHIVAGTLTWSTGGERHRAVAKHIHPQFSMSPRIINDIAILKVTPAFNLHKSSVGTIGLGGTNRVGEKVKVSLTGWGATAPTAAGGLPKKLQQLHYQTISNEECGRKGFRVTRNEICALSSKGQGACVGDSGGPLVTAQSPTQLVGVVSYGSATCAQGRPDVYTRVSSFTTYINKVMSSEIP